MTDKKKRKWSKWLTAYAPLFLWTIVVLGLSTSGASMSRTSLIIGPLLHFFFPYAPEETITLYHGYIRKAAHLTEYAILGGLALRAFTLSAASLVNKFRWQSAILYVALIASLDEFNQSFDPARTGSILDVGLDICGGLFAVVILSIIFRRLM